MQWASAITQLPDAAAAAQDLLRQLRTVLGDARPDLLLLFVSPAYATGLPVLAETVRMGLRPGQWGALTARGVIGAGREVEDGVCASAVAAMLPDVEVSGRHVTYAGLPDPDAAPGAWLRLLGLESQPQPNFLVFADPFGEPEPLLAGLDYAFPGSVTVGGLVSGGQRAGQNRLIWNGRVFAGGALLVSLAGNLRLDPVVAQGCRPVGDEVVITALGAPNLLTGVNQTPPLAFLEKLDQALPSSDRTLLRQALFLGIATGGEVEKPDDAGYLIRNVMDMDYTRGGLWVGARLEEGMRVRFHVRDRSTSREDLERHLARVAPGGPPSGVLLFNCLGRGQHLYGVPHHDARLVAEKLGHPPLGGFFASGEIGPVSGQTQVHGYTASIALIRPAR